MLSWLRETKPRTKKPSAAAITMRRLRKHQLLSAVSMKRLWAATYFHLTVGLGSVELAGLNRPRSQSEEPWDSEPVSLLELSPSRRLQRFSLCESPISARSSPKSRPLHQVGRLLPRANCRRECQAGPAEVESASRLPARTP